jgi:hypothetical protein
MATYVKLTKCPHPPSVSLYDATTDSTNSLINQYFQKNIEYSDKQVIDKITKNFIQKVNIIDKFKAAFTMVRYILTCFYFYNTLELDENS